MWSPEYYDKESDDENYVDFEVEAEVQPVKNFWEFILLILINPSFLNDTLN